MKQVFLNQAVSLGSSLAHQISLCKELGTQALPPIGGRMSASGNQIITRETMAANIRLVKMACEHFSLIGSQNQATHLEFTVEHDPRQLSFSELAGQLGGLMNTVLSESFRQFLAIQGTLARYVGQEKPFGDAVYDAFPSARNDLTEAGNCIACELSTASAFHLMRATEVGIRELGRDRRVPSAAGDKIDYAQWGQIVSEIEREVQAIAQWPNSTTKDDAQRYYNSAIVEIRAFNDGWRKHIAHARPQQTPMTTQDAEALWGHVNRFFSGLASKIGEGRYTDRVW